MQVTRKSILTGIERTRDLDVTQEQLDAYTRGEGYVQTIFPHLNANDREFIMSGITEEEWDDIVEEDDFSIEEGDEE